MKLGGIAGPSGFVVYDCASAVFEASRDVDPVLIEKVKSVLNGERFRYTKLFSRNEQIILLSIELIMLFGLFLFTDLVIFLVVSPFVLVLLNSYVFIWTGFFHLREWRQVSGWHACEHKVINLFERGLEVNRVNLKAANRVHMRCGNSIDMRDFNLLALFLFLASWLCFFYCSMEIVMPLEKVESLIIASFFCRGLVLLACVYCLIAIVLIPVYLFQYWISTKEPSDRQLEEALAVAQKFAEKIGYSPK